MPQKHFLLFKEFGYRCFLRAWIFTDMNFPEPFQTIALGLLSHLVVRIINHMIVFPSYFPSPSTFFHALRVAFFNFLKNYNKKTAWWVLYFVTPQVSGAEMFLGDFFGIPWTNNQYRNCKRMLLSFLIFFL